MKPEGQQRKEFEEWALDKVTSLIIDEIDSEYFWVETHLAWEAWQAAQKGLTEQRDGLRSGIDYASDQLTAVTESLQSPIEVELDMIRGKIAIPDRSEFAYIKQVKKLTEQRDRLAEALRECSEDSSELLGERDWWQNEPRLDFQKRYQETRDNVTRADEALQSLTTNEL
jgi:hypothetical protein